jgi:hypothetical protein
MNGLATRRPRTELAVVLDATFEFLTRHVAFRTLTDPETGATMTVDADAITLWVAHTHALPWLDITPRLILVSPEMESGKSRVLECLEVLCPRALMGMNMSVPFLFRSMSQEPTILLDEIDMVFQGEDRTNRRDLQAVMNAGHRRGAVVGRVETNGGVRVPIRFPVFGPMAIAGNELPPGTVVSRAITITMFRRKADQLIEDFTRGSQEDAGPIMDRLVHWAEMQGPQVVDPRPVRPKGITDRAADVWVGLLAIAELAGDD